MLAEKHKDHYSQVLGWLWCRTTFAHLHSAIMSTRGNRSPFPSTVPDISFASYLRGEDSEDLTHLTYSYSQLIPLSYNILTHSLA